MTRKEGKKEETYITASQHRFSTTAVPSTIKHKEL